MPPEDPLSGGSTIEYPLPGDVVIEIQERSDIGPQPDTGQVVFDFSTLNLLVPNPSGDNARAVSGDNPPNDQPVDTPIVPSTNFVSSIYSDNQVSARYYVKYRVASRYMTDTGLRQQAVCGSAGTPPEEVRVHGGRTRKIVGWIAERLGAWPEIPHWNTGVQGETLRYKEFWPDTPFPQMDGTTQMYRIKGVYVYDCAYVLQDTDPLNVGTTDVVNIPATENVVGYGQFNYTLLQGLQPDGPFGAIAS